MTKLKTILVSEATNIQLDWLVAKCNGDFELYHDIETGPRFIAIHFNSAFLHYSTNWANGGPVIEREKIELTPPYLSMPRWDAYKVENDTEFRYYVETGTTPLIAAMRCYVSSKLGDKVEIPEELI